MAWMDAMLLIISSSELYIGNVIDRETDRDVYNHGCVGVSVRGIHKPRATLAL